MSTREGVGESDSEASREEPQARAGLTTIRRDVHTVFRSRLADVVRARDMTVPTGCAACECISSACACKNNSILTLALRFEAQ